MRGVYPVYLVASDMSGIYLTLNQGVTEPGLGGLSRVRAAVSRAVGHLSGFTSRPMPYWALAVPKASKRISDYETGCIVYKFYDARAMPSDRELRRDLLVLVKAYVAWVESRPSVPAAGTAPPAMPAVTAPAEEHAGATPSATLTVTASAEEPVSALKERLIQRVRKLSPKGLKLLVGEL